MRLNQLRERSLLLHQQNYTSHETTLDIDYVETRAVGEGEEEVVGVYEETSAEEEWNEELVSTSEAFSEVLQLQGDMRRAIELVHETLIMLHNDASPAALESSTPNIVSGFSRSHLCRVSRCHRRLGSLYMAIGNPMQAKTHINIYISIARMFLNEDSNAQQINSSSSSGFALVPSLLDGDKDEQGAWLRIPFSLPPIAADTVSGVFSSPSSVSSLQQLSTFVGKGSGSSNSSGGSICVASSRNSRSSTGTAVLRRDLSHAFSLLASALDQVCSNICRVILFTYFSTPLNDLANNNLKLLINYM